CIARPSTGSSSCSRRTRPCMGDEIAVLRDRPRREGPGSSVTGAGVTIRLARSDDLASIVEIERAAGELFRSVGMDLVADDDPPTVQELAFYAEGGRAFVAVGADDRRSGICCSTRRTGPLTSSRSACTRAMPAAVS